MEDYPDNPFSEAITDFLELLRGLEFERPYLAQVIYAVVLLFLLVLLYISYLTIGIAAQISALLWKAAVDSFENIDEADNLIEASSHGVAAGTFAIIAIPFAAFVSPVALLGWALDIFQKMVSFLKSL